MGVYKGLSSQQVFLSTYYVPGAELGDLRTQSHFSRLEVRRPGLCHFLGCKDLGKAFNFREPQFSHM